MRPWKLGGGERLLLPCDRVAGPVLMKKWNFPLTGREFPSTADADR
jgi:hypothetical protein